MKHEKLKIGTEKAQPYLRIAPKINITLFHPRFGVIPIVCIFIQYRFPTISKVR